ncbi:MAG: RNA polymerase sigma factor [Eubacterium sp.]
MSKRNKNELYNSEWHKDYLLVQKVLTGDNNAWNRLYKKVYPIVYGYVAKRRTKWFISYDEIDDVVNEAFKRCYKKLNIYNGKSKFSTWVCGFCRYILLENLRKHNKYNKSQYIMRTSFELQSKQYDPENALIVKELNTCIWTAFSSLSLQHRLLLQCYILEEISVSQLKKQINLNSDERQQELDVAILTLRNRFLAIYEKKRL